MTQAENDHIPAPRSHAAETGRSDLAKAYAWGGIAIVISATVLALIWYTSSALLLIFAGILFGFFLVALTRLIAFTRLGYAIRLTIVCILLTVMMSAAIALGGQTIARETSLLATTLRTQVVNIKAWLEERGIDTGILDFNFAHTPATQDQDAAQKPSPTTPSLPAGTGAVLSQTLQIVLGTVAAVGNFFVIIFLGILTAAQPTVYRDGLLRLVPARHRGRAGAFLRDTGETLHRWLLGQLLTMISIFAIVWIGLLLLGVPSAFILGFQAGLLAFVPTVGAIVSGAIIILASLSSGWVAVAGAAIIYLGVQVLETYVLTPFIQRQAIDIAPATIFAAQIMFGVLFGLWGLTLALPLIVITRVALDHYYLSPRSASDLMSPPA